MTQSRPVAGGGPRAQVPFVLAIKRVPLSLFDGDGSGTFEG